MDQQHLFGRLVSLRGRRARRRGSDTDATGIMTPDDK
jgi:hypothetical protein